MGVDWAVVFYIVVAFPAAAWILCVLVNLYNKS
jgi:hypothetical protein